MRSLLCILSGLPLALFFFLSSPDAIAAPGFKTDLRKTVTSRSYIRSSSASTENTDGANQSKLAPSNDDEGGGEMITVTPVNNLESQLPGQVGSYNPVEQFISNHLSASATLSVDQQDDQGHISINGQQALWLSDFLTGNNNPVQSLNENSGMFFIPEFFGATFAHFISATTPVEADAGSLVWFELPVQTATGGGASTQNTQLTIQFFTNTHDEFQMNLFMDHINTITDAAVIATAILDENIEADPLQLLTDQGFRVRRDSLSKTYHVVDTIDGAPRTSQKSKSYKGGGMSSISEENDAMAVMLEILLVNKTEPHA